MTGPAPVDGGSAHAPLLEAVAVMDRLRSPGGCPWDAEQTHASLVRYLLDECYQLVESVESGDRMAIREELGDVLLQVLFHARIAAEIPRDQGGFGIDDVAGDLVAKLVRRHPHVFADAAPTWTATDQQQRWDELKKAERGKSGVLDGVAFGQPALALAAKLGSRAAAFGLDVPPAVSGGAETGVETVAAELFRIAYAAGARGEDPESALRALARAQADALAVAQARSAIADQTVS